MSAKNPRVTASAGALGQIKLDPKYRGTQDVDPLVLAAQMFQPRSTDSFEKWAREKLGSWLNPAQVMINDSILRNRYTAVPSCHAAGKSFFAACKIGHFIDSHPIGSAFVVSTAPTSAQIEAVVWRELNRVHAKADLRGRITRSGFPQWRVGDELIAFGRRPTEISPLVNGSPVQTPNGPVPIEQLRIGDEVFGLDGSPIKVLQVQPKGVKPTLKITFSDDVEVRCGYDHLWQVIPRVIDWSRSSHGGGAKNYVAGTSKLVTAEELTRLNLGVQPHLQYAIPTCEPVRYSRKNFVINPYVLGVLIGDGCLTDSNHASFTSIDDEVIREVESRLPAELKIKRRSKSNQWSLLAVSRGKRNVYSAEIRRILLGVKSGSKFIPSEYLRGSVRQRVELLRGLMDTDGTPPRRSDFQKATFYTTSLRLARDVQELARSLGGTARLDGPYEREYYTHPKTGKRIKHYCAQYQVELRTPGNPFLLPRKAEKWRIENKWSSYRRIKSIEPCGDYSQTCISVSASDGLFLTEGFITTHNSFQGIHSRFILIVLDEADGVDESLFVAADTLASSGQARVLAIGNPDGSDTHFSRICRPGSGWNVVRIDGLRTPNFTERGVALYPELKQYMIDNDIPFSDEAIKHVPELVKAEWRDMLLSPEWVHERMQRWGVRRDVDENHKVKWTEPALWLSKVRGRAPSEGSEGIIPLRWVELAIERWLEWEAQGRPKLEGRVIFGGDIADSGKDETVISHRVGYSIIDFVRTPLQDTDTTAKRLAARLRSSPEGTACIDGSGIGAGVVNQLRGLTLPVISFVGASSAEGVTDQTGEFTFANKRTAAYWHLREILDPVNSNVLVMLPPDEDMKADLTIPTWEVKTGAVIAMEPKKQLVKRMRRSPDVGDCTAITFWPSSAGRTRIKIHEYSQTSFREGEWAPEPNHRPVRPEQRLDREEEILSRRQRNEQRQRHVYSYAESGWDEEQFS